MKHNLFACLGPNSTMSKLLCQQSGYAFVHHVFARAVERIYSQGRGALPASCTQYVFQVLQSLS